MSEKKNISNNLGFPILSLNAPISFKNSCRGTQEGGKGAIAPSPPQMLSWRPLNPKIVKLKKKTKKKTTIYLNHKSMNFIIL